jgi:hypothetical protein
MTNTTQTPMLMTTKVERYTEHALNNLTTGLASNGQPYTYIDDKKNLIVHSLQSKWLKHWLRKIAHTHGDILRNDDLKEIIENVLAHAAVDEKWLSIHLRSGHTEEGFVELDIGNANLDRVLFKDGNPILTSSGSRTLFSRPESMLPLPYPAEKGDWKQLLPFLNMVEDDQYLTLGFMTFVMTHPRGTCAYPIMIVQGPQGGGKSLLCRGVFRAFVDNNAADIQLLPASSKDMVISTRSQFLLIYDNVRKLSTTQSEYFCVISTGGSMGGRKLFTDNEEVTLQAQTPVVLNSIHSIVKEPDLASRCVTVQVQPLEPDKRREEKELKHALSSKKGVIFKGLLDLCASALQIEDSVELLYTARLTSFSRWLAALEPAMGLPAGRLQKAYSDNLRGATLETIQDNALAITILNFATALPVPKWSGTSTQLLAQLNKTAPPNTTHRQAEWPQSPISLSKRLKLVAPMLQSQGVEIDFSHGTKRQIEITCNLPQTGKALDEPDGLDEISDPNVQPIGLASCSPTQE